MRPFDAEPKWVNKKKLFQDFSLQLFCHIERCILMGLVSFVRVYSMHNAMKIVLCMTCACQVGRMTSATKAGRPEAFITSYQRVL